MDSDVRGVMLHAKERKRDKKSKHKKHKRRAASSDEDCIGPKIPENFAEQEQNETQAVRDQVLDSYKRPRKQRPNEPLHPADERKLTVEKAIKE